MSNNIKEERINKNFAGRLLPIKVEDISHYKIGMPLLGEETTTVTNLTISDLLNKFSSGKPYPTNEILEGQVIIVWFSGEGQYFTNNEVWNYVHEANIIPTFAFNYVALSSYMPDVDEYEETYFVFGYVLNTPVLDEKFMDRLIKNLSKDFFDKFAFEWDAGVTTLSSGHFGMFNNITETYISNNIYIPILEDI